MRPLLRGGQRLAGFCSSITGLASVHWLAFAIWRSIHSATSIRW